MGDGKKARVPAALVVPLRSLLVRRGPRSLNGPIGGDPPGENILATVASPAIEAQMAAPLSTSFAYYLDRALPSRDRVSFFLWEFLLLCIAASGCYNYKEPAEKLSGNSDLSQLYAYATILSAAAVLYNATSLYLQDQRNSRIPKDLGAVLKPNRTKQQDRRHTIGVVVASAISSMPLVAVSWTFPISNKLGVTLFWLAVLWFDNTALHLLPAKLTLENPWYRLPALPFQALHREYNRHRMSPQQQLMAELEKTRDVVFSDIKAHIVGQLGFKQRQYHLNFSQKYLTEGGERAPLLESAAESTSELDLYDADPARGPHHQRFIKAMSIVGGSWVSLSCVGYLIEPVVVFSKLLGSTLGGILFSLPSIYLLTALLFFFGSSFLPRIVNGLTDRRPNTPKIPLIFKLYPKSSFLMLAVVAPFLSVLSFAAAVEMVKVTWAFKMAKTVHDVFYCFFMGCAYSGVPLLSYGALTDFTKIFLTKWAGAMGSEAVRKVVVFDSTFAERQQAVRLMDGGAQLRELQGMSPTGRLSILGDLSKGGDFSAEYEALSEMKEKEDRTEFLVGAGGEAFKFKKSELQAMTPAERALWLDDTKCDDGVLKTLFDKALPGEFGDAHVQWMQGISEKFYSRVQAEGRATADTVDPEARRQYLRELMFRHKVRKLEKLDEAIFSKEYQVLRDIKGKTDRTEFLVGTGEEAFKLKKSELQAMTPAERTLWLDADKCSDGALQDLFGGLLLGEFCNTHTQWMQRLSEHFYSRAESEGLKTAGTAVPPNLEVRRQCSRELMLRHKAQPQQAEEGFSPDPKYCSFFKAVRTAWLPFNVPATLSSHCCPA